MREICFRGKSEDNGEWLFGDLFHRNEEVLIKNYFEGFNISVIRETVGQYTGLTDKNGRRIFEGDIAELKRFGDTCVGKILFNQRTAGFEFWWNVTVGAYGEKATHAVNLSVCHDINVIGNIHDNPELLKERKK